MKLTTTAWRRLHRVFWAALFLAAAVAPATAQNITLDRTTLTGRLVPITGETERSVDLTVPFRRGSAELTEAARRQLDELGAALAGAALRRFAVGVYGHTDASGPAAFNLALSEKRAAAVVSYLVGRFALDPARFRHGGYGETRLLEGFPPTSPRHRRVEILVHAREAVSSGGDTGVEYRKDNAPRGGSESGFQAIE